HKQSFEYESCYIEKLYTHYRDLIIILLSLIMTAVQSGNWKLSTGRSDDDTVVSAEVKSQPLRRRSSRDPRESGKTKGSHPRISLCPRQTLVRLHDLQDTSRAEPGR
ncbi:hypothetical protein ALC53_06332, partial [Atta colombica]